MNKITQFALGALLVGSAAAGITAYAVEDDATSSLPQYPAAVTKGATGIEPSGTELPDSFGFRWFKAEPGNNFNANYYFPLYFVNNAGKSILVQLNGGEAQPLNAEINEFGWLYVPEFQESLASVLNIQEVDDLPYGIYTFTVLANTVYWKMGTEEVRNEPFSFTYTYYEGTDTAAEFYYNTIVDGEETLTTLSGAAIYGYQLNPVTITYPIATAEATAEDGQSTETTPTNNYITLLEPITLTTPDGSIIKLSIGNGVEYGEGNMSLVLGDLPILAGAYTLTIPANGVALGKPAPNTEGLDPANQKVVTVESRCTYTIDPNSDVEADAWTEPHNYKVGAANDFQSLYFTWDYKDLALVSMTGNVTYYYTPVNSTVTTTGEIPYTGQNLTSVTATTENTPAVAAEDEEEPTLNAFMISLPSALQPGTYEFVISDATVLVGGAQGVPNSQASYTFTVYETYDDIVISPTINNVFAITWNGIKEIKDAGNGLFPYLIDADMSADSTPVYTFDENSCYTMKGYSVILDFNAVYETTNVPNGIYRIVIPQSDYILIDDENDYPYVNAACTSYMFEFKDGVVTIVGITGATATLWNNDTPAQQLRWAPGTNQLGKEYLQVGFAEDFGSARITWNSPITLKNSKGVYVSDEKNNDVLVENLTLVNGTYLTFSFTEAMLTPGKHTIKVLADCVETNIEGVLPSSNMAQDNVTTYYVYGPYDQDQYKGMPTFTSSQYGVLNLEWGGKPVVTNSGIILPDANDMLNPYLVALDAWNVDEYGEPRVYTLTDGFYNYNAAGNAITTSINYYFYANYSGNYQLVIPAETFVLGSNCLNIEYKSIPVYVSNGYMYLPRNEFQNQWAETTPAQVEAGEPVWNSIYQNFNGLSNDFNTAFFGWKDLDGELIPIEAWDANSSNTFYQNQHKVVIEFTPWGYDVNGGSFTRTTVYMRYSETPAAGCWWIENNIVKADLGAHITGKSQYGEGDLYLPLGPGHYKVYIQSNTVQYLSNGTRSNIWNNAVYLRDYNYNTDVDYGEYQYSFNIYDEVEDAPIVNKTDNYVLALNWANMNYIQFSGNVYFNGTRMEAYLVDEEGNQLTNISGQLLNNGEGGYSSSVIFNFKSLTAKDLGLENGGMFRVVVPECAYILNQAGDTFSNGTPIFRYMNGPYPGGNWESDWFTYTDGIGIQEYEAPSTDFGDAYGWMNDEIKDGSQDDFTTAYITWDVDIDEIISDGVLNLVKTDIDGNVISTTPIKHSDMTVITYPKGVSPMVLQVSNIDDYIDGAGIYSFTAQRGLVESGEFVNKTERGIAQFNVYDYSDMATTWKYNRTNNEFEIIFTGAQVVRKADNIYNPTIGSTIVEPFLDGRSTTPVVSLSEIEIPGQYQMYVPAGAFIVDGYLNQAIRTIEFEYDGTVATLIDPVAWITPESENTIGSEFDFQQAYFNWSNDPVYPLTRTNNAISPDYTVYLTYEPFNSTEATEVIYLPKDAINIDTYIEPEPGVGGEPDFQSDEMDPINNVLIADFYNYLPTTAEGSVKPGHYTVNLKAGIVEIRGLWNAAETMVRYFDIMPLNQNFHIDNTINNVFAITWDGVSTVAANTDAVNAEGQPLQAFLYNIEEEEYIMLTGNQIVVSGNAVVINLSTIKGLEYGDYYFVIPQGMYFLNGNTLNGEVISYEFYYGENGTTGIAGIAADADGMYRVYNLNGVMMLQTRDASDLKNLNGGLYIINGKKVNLRK